MSDFRDEIENMLDNIEDSLDAIGTTDNKTRSLIAWLNVRIARLEKQLTRQERVVEAAKPIIESYEKDLVGSIAENDLEPDPGYCHACDEELCNFHQTLKNIEVWKKALEESSNNG